MDSISELNGLEQCKPFDKITHITLGIITIILIEVDCTLKLMNLIRRKKKKNLTFVSWQYLKINFKVNFQY